MAGLYRINPFQFIQPSDKAKEFMDNFRKNATVLSACLQGMPDCHERDVAREKIEEAVMWANKGACYEIKDTPNANTGHNE